MIFDILTLFPEFFDSFCRTSIIGRACENNLISIRCHNIRDFSDDKHKKVDDVPYGGGAGMVMTPQPLFDAITYVKKLTNDDAPVLFLTPQGKIFKQEHAEMYTQKYTRIILLCGHYEGIDQRIRDTLIDGEISIGQFVLTGGELPAQIFIDALSRLIPGVLGKEESHQEESFSVKLDRNLEYPHYTRPAIFKDMAVPDILLSGHHAHIEQWRKAHTRPSSYFQEEKH